MLFFVISAVGMFAQLPTATILGTVKDSSGAVVAGAPLTARNTETGQTRTTATAADGSYRLAALPVGSYEIRVEQAGFQREVRSGLTLTVGQEAVVNFTLQVGAVEQTVAVTAEAPLVNTTSGSLGGLVDEQKMADLPLNGRNYIQLSLLQPGVLEHRSKSATGNETQGTWYSSNGAPVRSNNYMLDGAIMQNFGGTNTGSMSGATLGVEGIREYRVITNSFSAEYGMTMGSQMVIVSKGGTNSLHGSVFEYLRNDNLDARNFFDRKTALTPGRLPEFKRNNFGASLGGPIVHDKLFVFGTFEGLRERLGVTTVSNTIPTSARQGAVAPVIQPLLALYPEPNLPNNQYTYPYSEPNRDDFGQVRVDNTLSDSDSWFVRYTATDGERLSTTNFPQFSIARSSRAQFTTLAEHHVFSPTLLNTFRFSYSRFARGVTSTTELIGPQYSFVPGQDMGPISISGITTLGPSNTAPIFQRQNIFSWSDDLFYTRGQHAFKFGTLINRYQQFVTNGSGSKGGITFANLTTFLQGIPSQIDARTPGSIADRTYHYTTMGFYIQDDWRVRSNFTLNLGLRYEFNTQPIEARGLGANLIDTQLDANTTLGLPFVNPSKRNLSPRFGFAWDVLGDGKTALRGGFGLLYDVGNLGNTLSGTANAMPPFSRRSTLANPGSLVLPLTFPDSAAGKTLETVDYFMQQPHLLQYNFAVERQLPFEMALTLAYAGSRGLNLIRLAEGNPILPLGVRQGGVCVTRPAGQTVDLNGPTCWLASPNNPRINPNWASIELKHAAGNSWYNGLQFSLLKRLSRALQFQSSYTWSKVIDENQGQLGVENTGTTSQPVDPFHRTSDRGPAAFDATHNWRFNAIYRLPTVVSSGGAAGKLLNGWWTSGILSLATGYPFSPSLQTNRSRSGVAAGASNIDRPDVVLGRNNGNIILGGPDKYFDPNAFTIPAAGFLGTAARNMLRTPGYANLDFSLAKDTALRFLGERGKLEFRAEVFNIFNRANFDVPSRTVFAARADVEVPVANAGVITRTATTSRQIQFALKVLF
ncbi:MAG: TonB-dependent receptor [Acidobacteria bacterium]|nr:TonB-dependent receptor [Acidobacteriota bacterium]